MCLVDRESGTGHRGRGVEWSREVQSWVFAHESRIAGSFAEVERMPGRSCRRNERQVQGREVQQILCERLCFCSLAQVLQLRVHVDSRGAVNKRERSVYRIAKSKSS
ncbi:hypothetical protein MA16_Dca016104 [Dendrobium catenatum]|uniref:Uncharacterized protein n=1 Tax=Dendrobium catenatum TaxID=906689 RepID=A0A2I0WIY3_9ASPA|nr:hypothetical protein MA16_Dca016104 [Dendrobium catenatum]